MQRLTTARMFELAHWRSGVFSYDEPEQMPEFKISIQGDVQELLLQTQLRIDHGDRPRKRAVASSRTICAAGCTVTDCTPAVKLKYLKKDACLWRKMSSPPDVSSIAHRAPAQGSAGSTLRRGRRTMPPCRGHWGQF